MSRSDKDESYESEKILSYMRRERACSVHANLPVRVPSNPECKDVIIREEGPEQKKNKKKVGRRPCHETVKLGCPTAGFCRGQGRVLGERAHWRGGTGLCHILWLRDRGVSHMFGRCSLIVNMSWHPAGQQTP